jgi:hypothetical protein
MNIKFPTSHHQRCPIPGSEWDLYRSIGFQFISVRVKLLGTTAVIAFVSQNEINILGLVKPCQADMPHLLKATDFR